MDLRECYQKFGGDFDGVLSRLRREQLVEKFIYKFLDDKSYELFETSMENGDYEEALRAVHTLKGICQNLSFDRLYESSSRITNALKGNDREQAAQGMPQLSADYQQILVSVREYRQFKGE